MDRKSKSIKDYKFSNLTNGRQEIGSKDLLVYPQELGSKDVEPFMLFTIYDRKPLSLQSIKNGIVNQFNKMGETGGEESLAKAMQRGVYNVNNEEIRQENSKRLNRYDPRSSKNVPRESQSTRLKPAQVELKESIALYLPGALTNVDSLSYEEKEMFGRAFTDISGEGVGALAAKAAKSIINALPGEGFENTVTALSGVMINPRKEQLFTGSTHRKFQFEFQFSPRNENEVDMVHKIIKTFRYYARPKFIAKGVFMNLPAEFLIEYYDVKKNEEGIVEYAEENLFLNRIGRCVLTDIETNYTPQQIASFHQDGSPTQINLTLSFTEIEIISQDHIMEGF